MRVSRLSMGPPVPYPVSFRLIGPDIAELRRLVLPKREIMEAEPTAQSFKTEMGERAPAFRLRFDQERVHQIGLSPESVSALLQTFHNERSVNQVRDGIRTVEVVIRAIVDERRALHNHVNRVIVHAPSATV